MPAVETERFLVHQSDNYPGHWEIEPLQISEPWKMALGDNWDITLSSAPEFTDFYHSLKDHWDAAYEQHDEDILICEVDVEYTFKLPPGGKALRYGRHNWADRNQFWFLLASSTETDQRGFPRGIKTWQVVGGFVRTVKMAPLLEGSHIERRRTAGNGQQSARRA